MRSSKRPRLIYVEWDDHIVHAGTFDRAGVAALKLAVQYSVGWMVRQDDSAYWIAQTMTDSEDGTLLDAADVLVVDKRMVRRHKFIDGLEEMLPE